MHSRSKLPTVQPEVLKLSDSHCFPKLFPVILPATKVFAVQFPSSQRAESIQSEPVFYLFFYGIFSCRNQTWNKEPTKKLKSELWKKSERQKPLLPAGAEHLLPHWWK